MKREDAKLNQEVKSTCNQIYTGTYTIVKVFKTCCWVKLNQEAANGIVKKGHIYKGVPYSYLEPVMTPEKVKEYADKDSMALKDVVLEDMLEEIYIRGGESSTLDRLEVIRKTKELADNMQTAYTNSI